MLYNTTGKTFAIEPSRILRLPKKAELILNTTGGISHNTYTIKTDNNKYFFKKLKKNYRCTTRLKEL